MDAHLVLNRTEETGLLLGGLTTRVENSENLARGEAMTSAAATVALSPSTTRTFMPAVDW